MYAFIALVFFALLTVYLFKKEKKNWLLSAQIVFFLIGWKLADIVRFFMK